VLQRIAAGHEGVRTGAAVRPVRTQFFSGNTVSHFCYLPHPRSCCVLPGQSIYRSIHKQGTILTSIYYLIFPNLIYLIDYGS
jgi:hypothetical protein